MAKNVRDALARFEDPMSDADANSIVAYIEDELATDGLDPFEVLLAIEGRNGRRIEL